MDIVRPAAGKGNCRTASGVAGIRDFSEDFAPWHAVEHTELHPLSS
jgi:hypothetical protein